MRSAAEHVNDRFAQQVQSFAAELDERAQRHFPEILARALTARGIPAAQMSARETAFADALLDGMLEIVGEIVGMALRRSAELVSDAFAHAQLSFAESGTRPAR